MGTNGSFDIATITDLFLLEMIYKEDYKINPTIETYNKVGDDLWCFDPSEHVYNTYTEMCGISINVQKTKSATEGNLRGEFVSRSLNYGKDVSRISANICRAVKKNLLDLPQLAVHLSERNYGNIIPLREIFDDCKVKEYHLRNYLRTFYILCELHPRSGLSLLKKSLEEQYPVEIYGDQLITIIKTYGVVSIKDSYYSYLIKSLLNSISEKMGRIMDSVELISDEINSSAVLLSKAEPDKL